MADPIRVPVTAFQKARLLAFQKDQEEIQQKAQDALTRLTERFSDTIAGIVARDADVEKLAAEKWTFKLDGDEIVCTPPEPTPVTEPPKVE